MRQLGNIIIIVGPNSSGKSAITSLIAASKYNFKPINTKVIEARVKTKFGNLFFRETLRKASDYLDREVENVRELLYLRYNVIEDKKFIELTNDLDNVSDYSEFYYDILYNDYFNETVNILSQDNNCVIDHNIFLSSVGRQKFFNIFKNLKKRIKIIEIFSPLQKYYSNLVKRNNRFYEFADTYTDGSELIKAIKKHDQSVGKADLSFRRPLRSLEIWNEHFAFTKKTPKDTNLILQKLKGNELKKIINSIISDHKKLLNYLITKKIPVSFSISKELNPSEISRYLNIHDEKEIFVVKRKLLKNDHLLNTENIVDIEDYAQSDILNNLVEGLFSDIKAL